MDNPAYIYAFMAFMGLLQVSILGVLFRILYMMGRIQGEINGLREAIAALAVRVGRLEEQVGHLREQVAENRGLLRALHERVDLVMRHRHDDRTGSVVLTPTEPAPDPSAD